MSNTSTATQCWSCNTVTTSHDVICPTCGIIQVPVADVSYFALFEFSAPNFDIDKAALERRYFTLQQMLHPDRFIGKSDKERLLSLQQTMQVNQAYQTLLSDLLRAQYLLKQEGVYVNHPQSQDTVKPSQALLMQSLEDREALSEASTLEAITTLEKHVVEQTDKTITLLKQYFAAKEWMNAAEATIKLRYLEKFNDEIKERKRGLNL